MSENLSGRSLLEKTGQGCRQYDGIKARPHRFKIAFIYLLCLYLHEFVHALMWTVYKGQRQLVGLGSLLSSGSWNCNVDH